MRVGETPGRFEWQAGYGAFSYSQSAKHNVIRYIENQEAHHAQRTFKDEILKLNNLYELETDERDLPIDPL